jgi:hypothetical protein
MGLFIVVKKSPKISEPETATDPLTLNPFCGAVLCGRAQDRPIQDIRARAFGGPSRGPAGIQERPKRHRKAL